MIFIWFWWRYCCYEIVGLNRDSPRIPDPGPSLHPFSGLDTEKLMKIASTWYSTCSFWADLPIGRKIRCWLYQFPWKLALHPGVGIAQLTISKSPRNPLSSCTARPGPLIHACHPQKVLNILGDTSSTLYLVDSCGAELPNERIKAVRILGLFEFFLDLVCRWWFFKVTFLKDWQNPVRSPP